MPVYEFKCLDCGEQVTLVIPLSEYEKKDFICPKCDSKKLERQITSVQVVTSKKS
jgi:putative FmdB family regulatory protein